VIGGVGGWLEAIVRPGTDARTWLLTEGWLRHGRLSVHEVPATAGRSLPRSERCCSVGDPLPALDAGFAHLERGMKSL
jgi:hypothetical protein